MEIESVLGRCSGVFLFDCNGVNTGEFFFLRCRNLYSFVQRSIISVDVLVALAEVLRLS